VDAFSTGHTFSGNPLSAAAANRVLDYMEKHELLEKVEKMGIRLESSLEALKVKYPGLIHEVRGKGLLWGLELRNKGELFEPERRAAAKLVEICFQKGLLVYPSAGFIDGFLGESILLSPPYIIAEEEMDELIGILDVSLSVFK
jgi:4-aminobutyrate aminotransferase-like enzyme